MKTRKCLDYSYGDEFRGNGGESGHFHIEWYHDMAIGRERYNTAPAPAADVLAWFKDYASDGGYQSEINRVLRRYVAEAEKKRA